MRFRGVDPEFVYRWCGTALNTGAIPQGRNVLRMRALCALLELPPSASDADIIAELEQFKAHGKRRV